MLTKKTLPKNDYVRKEIRRYIEEHPDEELSIPPSRGIPTERHKDLVNMVGFAILDARNLFNSKIDYDINIISPTIDEEYERFHSKKRR